MYSNKYIHILLCMTVIYDKKENRIIIKCMYLRVYYSCQTIIMNILIIFLCNNDAIRI